MSSAVERFRAYGHPDVSSTHPSTFEITAEEQMTPAGSCIIAVRSEKGARDLSPEFRALLQKQGSCLVTSLTCRDVSVTVRSSGTPLLTLDHPTDMVWRRSSFTCGRTIGTYSDHTAATLPRELIRLLRAGECLEVVLMVESGNVPAAQHADPILPPCIFHFE